MQKVTAIAIAAALFKSHTGVEELHITSDGQAFFNDHHAANHARETIKDKIVIKVKKGETIEAETTETTASEKLGEAQNLVLEINAKQLKAKALQAAAKTDETKAKHQITIDTLDVELEAAKAAIVALEGE